MMSSELSEVDKELKERGLLTVEELMGGQPTDQLIKCNEVTDLHTFSVWLTSKVRELLKHKAKLILKGREESEIFEWVLGQYASFHEVKVNFDSAKEGTTNLRFEEIGFNSTSTPIHIVNQFCETDEKSDSTINEDDTISIFTCYLSVPIGDLKVGTKLDKITFSHEDSSLEIIESGSDKVRTFRVSLV